MQVNYFGNNVFRVNYFGNNVFRVKISDGLIFCCHGNVNLEHYQYLYFFIFEKANFCY